MEKIWNVQKLIEAIDNEELMLYVGNGVDMEANVEKRIVLFTHELKRSGAPSVLYNMSKVLLKLGYSVFLIADEDGELLEEFVAMGVNVILYTRLTNDPKWLVKIAEVFPKILVNTMVSMHIVTFLAPYAQTLYWWIHEAENAIEHWSEKVKEVPRVPALKLLAASKLIQKNLKQYWNMDSVLLNFYIEDVPAADVPKSEKINIINVGDVNGNKGQEILARAFDKLDENTKAKCDLYFCGDNQRYNEQILLEVLDFVDANENVHMLEGMPKAELYEVYDEVDIVVVASYYESTSAVAVEGLMKGKLCVCTQTCGVCEYLKDGENVFTFKRGDADSLCDALNRAINEYDTLDEVRRNGRKVFEQIYTEEVFTKNLTELLEGSVQINLRMNACTGCGACVAACPADAIIMTENEKGFLYPKIDNEKCIHCKKCVAVCPVNEKEANAPVKEGYALKRKDMDKLMESQSGGAFSAFAEEIISQGGVVYGVALNEECKATYIRVDAQEDLIQLKGSKYVQADLNNTYVRIKEDIKTRKVLFSGTPCYVAGLQKYLKNDNTDNLLTCDLICHGVPSPKLYKSHLEHLSERCGKKITDFNFRDKSYTGWHGHMETCTDDAGVQVAENVYANIFYTDACLRESCYSCQYANTERVADITIGDFWGVDKVFSDMDDNKGISLVLVNSERGRIFWKEFIKKADVEKRTAKIEKCLQRNLQIPTPRSKKTEEFWNDYLNCDYKKVVRKYGQPRLYERPNFSVLNCWQKKLEKAEGLTSILKARGVSKIFILGDKKNNQLAIMELKRGTIEVVGEIRFGNNEITQMVPIIEVDDKLAKEVEKIDTVLVTDESNMVDVLMALHKVNVPMEKVTPISFVVDEEV